MAPVWIVHRSARTRAALARLAGLGAEAWIGAPGESGFERGDAPRVIVLGLADDLEAELEFAHRQALRHPTARWILVAEAADRSEVARLFDTLDAEVLAYPPRREVLRARIAQARRTRPAHSLEERRRRDALTARFVRYFGDLDLPELLRALDPGAADLPLVIRGEPGTGRTLLARYVHAVAGNGPLLWVPGRNTASAAALEAALSAPRAGDFSVCVEDAETLAPDLQQLLVRWIELGPPGRAPQRWIVTLGDDLAGAPVEGIEPALLQALAGVSVRIPPLREREERIPRLASEWLDEWCRRRGRAPRMLTESAQTALRNEPWPDNLRELEAVLTASVARSPDGPLDADAIRFTDGAPAVPAVEDANRSAAAEDPTKSAAGADPMPSTVGDDAMHRELDDDDGSSSRDSDFDGAETDAQPVDAPLAAADDLPRLAGVLAHQIRNPLATIRTFASLLPEHAQDPEFRERFRHSVEGDVDRIERAVAQLADFAEFPTPGKEPVDLTRILEDALEERRQEIGERRLVVLKELERAAPFVRGDAQQLRFALERIIDHVLGQLPERGDLYLASKHLPAGGRAENGNGALRVLLRFDCASTGEAGSAAIDPAAARAMAPRETSLDLLLAERVVRGHRGELALDETAARERVIVVELPGA